MGLGKNYCETITKRSVIVMLIGTGLILLLFKDPKSYIYGLIFGGSINILNFRLMSISVRKSVNMSQNSAKRHTINNYMIRYLIYGLVLTIAALADYINLYTTIMSMFIVKIVIISDSFYDILAGKIRKRENNDI
ncbi:F-ATPase, F0 complex, subunit I AtpI [Gottschalkia purinilytica]|uniref:F-ATPase, F0 complex, subunit I AtpI n=1 Tax=Gottschalkia purinilytica TaxID=1503 RepID=A0A0L0WE58_GOTPU|nr:ATP synthase subunit I [Gottschalkia purinilytica]KNF09721.1 F-ATPase, F0 complex, subunit I AtpI [Gottschalkia purinilytica]